MNTFIRSISRGTDMKMDEVKQDKKNLPVFDPIGTYIRQMKRKKRKKKQEAQA